MSKIIGIGCDLFDISRLKGLFIRRRLNKFLNRILTDKEKTQFDALFPRTKTFEFASIENVEQRRMLKWIGIRWAVKESIYKV